MMHYHKRSHSTAALLLILLATRAQAAPNDSALHFGVVETRAGERKAIQWKVSPGSQLATDSLVLTVQPEKKTVFQSHALNFTPLTMYAVSVTTKRGPGTKARFSVRYRDADGQDLRRDLILQTFDNPRPGWIGLSPYRRTYVQNFCLPPSANKSRLEISLEGGKDSNYNFLKLFDINIREGRPVPFGQRRGKNLLPAGDMEVEGRGGIPLGWDTWGYKHPKLELSAEEAQRGNTCLRISPGVRFYLASASSVYVERGRAYEISFWAKGAGRLSVIAHPLSSSRWRPLPIRVGDPQARNVKLDAKQWKRFTHVWFAESPHVETAQVVFTIAPEEAIFLDGIELRLVEADLP